VEPASATRTIEYWPVNIGEASGSHHEHVDGKKIQWGGGGENLCTSHDNISKYLTLTSFPSTKEIKKRRGQEDRELKLRIGGEEQLHKEFESFLSAMKEYPEMYAAPRLRYLRNFVNLVTRCPDQYKSQAGDDTIELPVPQEDRGLAITPGYVKALADLESGSANPVLLVLAVDSEYQKDVWGIDKPQTVKMTELRLVDADGDQIHARLNHSLAEVGCMLRRGDKIRLDMFTPLRYRINSASPRMPMLFIHKMSRVGNQPLDDDDVKGMVPCSRAHPREHLDAFEPEDDNLVIDPRVNPKPACTPDNRLCAKYGIRFLTCVCDAIPVDSLDLETVKQDCYFATDELESMPNNHKRNMIFWWYATNIYSVVGKNNTERMPLCLEYAIREKYTNPDGVPFKGYRKRKR
jgi:hypothetical protein